MGYSKKFASGNPRKYSENAPVSPRGSRLKNPRKYSEEVGRGDHAPPLSRKAPDVCYSENVPAPPLSEKARSWDYSRKSSASPTNARSSLDGDPMGPSSAAKAAQKAAMRK